MVNTFVSQHHIVDIVFAQNSKTRDFFFFGFLPRVAWMEIFSILSGYE